MSLHPQPIPPVPENPLQRRRPSMPDAQVLRARGPKGSGRMGYDRLGLLGRRKRISSRC
jgi:hypothetical protein